MLEPAQGAWGLEIAEAEGNSLQRCPEHREYAQLQMLMVFHQKTLGKERGRFEAVCGRQRRAAAQVGGCCSAAWPSIGRGSRNPGAHRWPPWALVHFYQITPKANNQTNKKHPLSFSRNSIMQKPT